MALQREHGRPHEQLEADERGDRVSGQPEDQRRASDAERDWLARLDRHAPEDLLDAELGLDPADQIVRSNGHAARRDEHVSLEALPKGLAVRVLVIGHRRQALRQRARRRQLCGEDQSIGLVDLARPKQLARRPELGSRGEHGGARPRGAHDLRNARRRQRAEVRRSKPRPGFDHGVAGVDITAARAHAGTGSHMIRDLDSVVTLDNILEGDDGIGSVGNDSARRDRHRLAGPELARGGSAGRDPLNDGQPARSVLRAQREPVHCGAGKRRKIDGRHGRLGQDAPTGHLQRYRLELEGPNPLQDQALGLVDRQQLGQDRHIRYALADRLTPP